MDSVWRIGRPGRMGGGERRRGRGAAGGLPSAKVGARVLSRAGGALCDWWGRRGGSGGAHRRRGSTRAAARGAGSPSPGCAPWRCAPGWSPAGRRPGKGQGSGWGAPWCVWQRKEFGGVRGARLEEGVEVRGPDPVDVDGPPHPVRLRGRRGARGGAEAASPPVATRLGGSDPSPLRARLVVSVGPGGLHLRVGEIASRGKPPSAPGRSRGRCGGGAPKCPNAQMPPPHQLVFAVDERLPDLVDVLPPPPRDHVREHGRGLGRRGGWQGSRG